MSVESDESLILERINSEKFKVAQAMKDWDTPFFNSLANLILSANDNDLLTIRQAFDEYWENFLNFD